MNINIYYNENNFVYLVPNNYNHSLKYINEVLEYAKTIGCTLPDTKEIRIETLRGEKYNRHLSIEFQSSTKPTKGFELTPSSGIYSWLVY